MAQNRVLPADELVWNELSQLVKDVRPSVSEFEVVRLASRVARQLGGVRPARRVVRPLSVIASLAAACLVAAVLVAGWDGSSGTPAEFRMARADDGGVVLEFTDGRHEHQVAKSDRPFVEQDTSVHSAKGRTFKDSNGTPRPGTVVFYIVD